MESRGVRSLPAACSPPRRNGFEARGAVRQDSRLPVRADLLPAPGSRFQRQPVRGAVDGSASRRTAWPSAKHLLAPSPGSARRCSRRSAESDQDSPGHPSRGRRTLTPPESRGRGRRPSKGPPGQHRPPRWPSTSRTDSPPSSEARGSGQRPLVADRDNRPPEIERFPGPPPSSAGEA